MSVGNAHVQVLKYIHVHSGDGAEGAAVQGYQQLEPQGLNQHRPPQTITIRNARQATDIRSGRAEERTERRRANERADKHIRRGAATTVRGRA